MDNLGWDTLVSLDNADIGNMDTHSIMLLAPWPIISFLIFRDEETIVRVPSIAESFLDVCRSTMSKFYSLTHRVATLILKFFG